MIRKVEIQRLTIVSSKPFEAVIAAVEKGIGRPDMSDFGKASSGAQTYAELETVVNRSVSELGLMLFMKAGSRCGAPQGKRSCAAESSALYHRQSSDHEGHGQACARSRKLCSDHAVD